MAKKKNKSFAIFDEPEVHGRKKGQKNMKKVAGYIVNNHGVTFTEKEKKALIYKVNSANRKRKRMLEEEGAILRVVAGKPTKKTIAETTGAFGYESDMVLHKKSKSLDKFRSRKEFDTYMNVLERVTKRDYIDKRMELYKENHGKAFETVFDEEHMAEDMKKIKEKIDKMSLKEYKKYVMNDEIMYIEYMYTKEEKDFKLTQIKNALGIE